MAVLFPTIAFQVSHFVTQSDPYIGPSPPGTKNGECLALKVSFLKVSAGVNGIRKKESQRFWTALCKKSESPVKGREIDK